MERWRGTIANSSIFLLISLRLSFRFVIFFLRCSSFLSIFLSLSHTHTHSLPTSFVYAREILSPLYRTSSKKKKKEKKNRTYIFHSPLRKSLNTEVVIPCPRVLCRETIGPRENIISFFHQIIFRSLLVALLSNLRALQKIFHPKKKNLAISRSRSLFSSRYLLDVFFSRFIRDNRVVPPRDARDGMGLWTGSITTPRQIFQ